MGEQEELHERFKGAIVDQQTRIGDLVTQMGTEMVKVEGMKAGLKGLADALDEQWQGLHGKLQSAFDIQKEEGAKLYTSLSEQLNEQWSTLHQKLEFTFNEHNKKMQRWRNGSQRLNASSHPKVSWEVRAQAAIDR